MKTVDFRGTVSEGTMRPQDLLPAIMDVLKEYHPEAYQLVISTIFSEFDATYIELCGDKDHPVWTFETMSWIINEVAWDAMNEIAPVGYYFGAHPGDGVDYGFWLVDTWEEGKEDHFCYCCGKGNVTLQPCLQCGKPLCQDCAPPFGGHVCDRLTEV